MRVKGSIFQCNLYFTEFHWIIKNFLFILNKIDSKAEEKEKSYGFCNSREEIDREISKYKVLVIN